MTEDAADLTGGIEELPGSNSASFGDDMRELILNGQAAAQAELAYQKARAAFAAERTGRIVLFGAIASALVLLTLVALVVGSVLALAPALGAWGATGAVCAVLLIVALLLALLARRQVRAIRAVLSDPEGPDDAR